MRVALFTEGIYPLKIGGIQKHSYLFAKYLAQRAINTDIYFYSDDFEATTKVSVHYNSEELAFLRFNSIPPPNTIYFPGHFIYFSWLASKAIFKAFEKNEIQYDLVYIQGFSGWAMLREKKFRKDLPVTVLNFHGLEMYQKAANVKSYLQQLAYRPFVEANLKAADYLVSLGGKLTELLQQKRSDKESILETPIGISRDWLLAAPKRPSTQRRFVFLGRYERRKGIEELNQVIKQLPPDAKIKFDFIGPIHEQQRIKLPFIHYHGLIRDSEQIKHILQSSDILVCPSWSEGMPTVILEAMASGCAIIATNVGAVSCLVNEENGWLLEAGDVQALNTVIQEGINLSSSQLLEKQEASLQLVKEQYTWDVVVDKFLDSAKSLS